MGFKAAFPMTRDDVVKFETLEQAKVYCEAVGMPYLIRSEDKNILIAKRLNFKKAGITYH